MVKLFIVTICALVASSVVAMPNMQGCGQPPNQKNPIECCDVPMIIEKATMDACAAKHGKPMGPPPSAGGAPSGPPPSGCMIDCALEATKAVVNGNLDVAVLKTYIKGRVSGDWTSVLEKAVDECVAENAGQKNDHPPMPKGGESACDHNFGHILGCIAQKSFQNCPASVYKASSECDELKKFTQKCPMPPPKM